jgi:lipopolysaccharide export LptBFGC system permease protein LptF
MKPTPWTRTLKVAFWRHLAFWLLSLLGTWLALASSPHAATVSAAYLLVVTAVIPTSILLFVAIALFGKHFVDGRTTTFPRLRRSLPGMIVTGVGIAIAGHFTESMWTAVLGIGIAMAAIEALAYPLGATADEAYA